MEAIPSKVKPCRKKFHIDFLPIRHTIKNYSWKKFRSDIRASPNVALLDFPQSMAYASIAGLPLHFGVICSAVSSIVGPIFASSRFIMLGPTNSTSVLLLSSFITLNLSYSDHFVALPILLLMVGFFMILGSFLKLAVLTQYISRSVITGYVTAAACLIVANQIHKILGYSIPSAGTFFNVLLAVAEHWHQIDFIPLSIAITTAITYWTLKHFFPSFPIVAITLILISCVVQYFVHHGIAIEMLPALSIKHWKWTVPKIDLEWVGRLGNAAFAMALLAILESSSISKSLAARAGDRVDMNQQLFSTGFANLANSFCGGMVVSGSLTRSIVNWSFGAKTPLSSVYSGICLLCSLILLGRYVCYIPIAALAMLIIIIGISLINWRQIFIVARATQSDGIVFLITFIGGLLFPLDTAIYLGAGASIILFLKKASRPQLVEFAFNESGELAEKSISNPSNTPEISIVHVEGDLFFGSSEIFLDQARMLYEAPNLKVIILRMRNAYNLDATSVLAIADLICFVRKTGREILISGAREEIERVLRNSHVMDILGEENFFCYMPENPNLSTRYALQRAQKIIGQDEAKIVIITTEKDKKNKAEGENACSQAGAAKS